MINPFASRGELSALQDYIERERWRLQCQALGATRDQIIAYEESARAWATTMVYPNHVVVETAMHVALDVLKRGEPMPEDAAEAMQAAWGRVLARLVGDGREEGT